MGTRADFYVGKGKDAEWIGSIAWDGYRGGIADTVLLCKTEVGFRAAVKAFFASRDDVTLPATGWPWPWDDSRISDCSYWFFDDRVWDAKGTPEVYMPCDEPEAESDEEYEASLIGRERIEFPNMANRKNVTAGARSGIILLAGR
jgi:hypothetical protein